jgi:hypothetical protein
MLLGASENQGDSGSGRKSIRFVKKALGKAFPRRSHAVEVILC